MKVWVLKEELDWLEKTQSEGRTRSINISSFRLYDNLKEIEVDLREEQR